MKGDKMKILRSTYGAAGIFFPVGKPKKGGTCEYASDKCLKKCYAMEKDYDEVLNIPEEDKREIYKFFIEKSTLAVCSEIIKEMDELQAKILTWFASGDCLDKDIDRLYQTMVLLNEESIVQNGFTRNQDFYRKIVDGGVIDHIVLTLESLSPEHNPARKYPRGLWAVPDYEKGLVKLYHGELGEEAFYGSCGSGSTRQVDFNGKEVEIVSNCTGCYYKKIGCFYIGK